MIYRVAFYRLIYRNPEIHPFIRQEFWVCFTNRLTARLALFNILYLAALSGRPMSVVCGELNIFPFIKVRNFYVIGLQLLTLIGVIDCKDSLINPQLSSLSLLFDITTSPLLLTFSSPLSQVSCSRTQQFSTEIII